MTFGFSAAAIGGIVAGVGGIGSAIIGANSAKKAANAQMGAAQAGIDQQNLQFERMQELLKPFVDAGTGAIGGQQDLIGANGYDKQNAAIEQLKQTAQFDQLNAQGQDAILQNASATGGLRGGSVQAALSQFSPNLLNGLIQQQFQNLGGLTSIGANAAAGVGNAGMQTGVNNANLLQQAGAAQAGGYLAQGKAGQDIINSVVSGYGTYKGLGGSF